MSFGKISYKMEVDGASPVSGEYFVVCCFFTAWVSSGVDAGEVGDGER